MQELFLKPRIFSKEGGTQVPPSFRSMVCPGSASVTATAAVTTAAAVAATAIIATAAPIAAPAAAGEQDDDEQDDPQAAVAAPAVVSTTHMFSHLSKIPPGRCVPCVLYYSMEAPCPW